MLSRVTRKRKGKGDTTRTEIKKKKLGVFDEEAQAREAYETNLLFGGGIDLKQFETYDESDNEKHTDESDEADNNTDTEQDNDTKQDNDTEQDSDSEHEDASEEPTNTPDSGVDVEQCYTVEEPSTSSLPPAWTDEDDEGINVSEAKSRRRGNRRDYLTGPHKRYKDALVAEYERRVGRPRWADAERSKDEDSEDDVLTRTCGFIQRSSAKHQLPGGELEFRRRRDLNWETNNEGSISSVEFHPSSSVALVTGVAGVVSLFAVDGKTNEKLHSVRFEKFPILQAKFTAGGNEAILGSNRKYMYNYDLIAAAATKVRLPHGMTYMELFALSPDSKFIAVASRWGEIDVLSARTKERVAHLKQDTPVSALCYDPAGSEIYSHGMSGDVTVFDTRAMRIRHRWTDSGCITGSTLTISPSGQFVAAGSMEGVVNLYGVEDALASTTPQPRKSVFNLTTSVNSLAFNPTGEILALGSRDVRNSIRLLHIGSGAAFANFPLFGTKLGNVTTVGFSPRGGYLAIGNTKSVVSLYRLPHYKNY